MLRLTSLVLLGCLSVAVAANPFGRFGYQIPSVPGFVIGPQGFRSNFGGSDTFRFPKPADKWKVVAVSDLSQSVYITDDEAGPRKIKIDLLSPGFSFFSPKEICLNLSSTSSPLISWSEGSVEAGVATPPTRWLLVSFRDNQPPILFGFPEGEVAGRIEGKLGAWTLKVPYVGWVRVALPVGARPWPTNTASDLGKLVHEVVREEKLYTQPAPELKRLTIKADETSVVATWQFTQPSAVVPLPAILAPLGGYTSRVLSPVRRVIDDIDGAGPIYVLTSSELKMRFPIRRLPTGRAVAFGGAIPPLAELGQSETAGIVNLALANLVGLSGPEYKDSALRSTETFVSNAAYIEEVFTGQRLPFGADGQGLDIAAAHALLMQSIGTTERASSDNNSLLTSLTWRRDWMTWKLWCPNQELSRRATAIASVAGALCPEPERRLEAAMMEAGLASDRGLLIWKARLAGERSVAHLLEPMADLRTDIFAEAEPADLGRTLISQLRVFGRTAVTAEAGDGEAILTLQAADAGEKALILGSGFPVTVSAGDNVRTIEATPVLGFTLVTITPVQAGACKVKVKLPAWYAGLPQAPAVVRYSETVR